ncbi:MAG: hypothetical protein ACREM8_00500 [Vulcanimicrobiaceae bacterium]
MSVRPPRRSIRREIIDTHGPGRLRARMRRAAVGALVIALAIVVIVAFLLERRVL